MIRWVLRLALVVAAFFIALFGSFVAFNPLGWETYPPADEALLDNQDILNIITMVVGIGVAIVLWIKTRGLTDGSFSRNPNAWRRLRISVLLGVLAGLAVMVVVNQIVSTRGLVLLAVRDYFDFWGLFAGFFAAVAVFVISQSVVSRRRRH